MSLTPIVFILVILLFGFDSTAASTKNSRKKSEIFSRLLLRAESYRWVDDVR